MSSLKEKKTRLQEAEQAQKLEREKNLRMMFHKGEITRVEFDRKMGVTK